MADKNKPHESGFIDDPEAAAAIVVTPNATPSVAPSPADRGVLTGTPAATPGTPDPVSPADGSAAGKLPDTLAIPAKDAAVVEPSDDELASDLVQNGGEFSKDTLAKLKKLGYTDIQVARAKTAATAAAQGAVAAVAQAVGGAERLQQVISWAAESLPEDRRNAYNEQLNSSKPMVRQMAALALAAEYERSEGIRSDGQIDGRQRPGKVNPLKRIMTERDYQEIQSHPLYTGFGPEADRYRQYAEEQLLEYATRMGM